MLLLLHEFWMLLLLFQNWINDLSGKILGQLQKGHWLHLWFDLDIQVLWNDDLLYFLQ